MMLTPASFAPAAELRHNAAMRPARDSLRALLSFAALCYLVAGISGVVTVGSVQNWYPTLAKPWFSPPNWIFGPVWTLLYGMIALAGWRVWRQGGAAPRAAWVAYGLQIGFNFLWSELFFGLHRPGCALLDMTLLWLAILANIVLFARQDRRAAWLLMPYFAWVSFAFLLNAAIVELN